MKRRLWIPLALLAIAALALTLAGNREQGTPTPWPAAESRQGGAVARADAARARGLAVQDRGVVTRLLSDDRQGSRHQRFLVRTDGGPTVLISHNIDLAARVGVREGDSVSFRGEYEWNEKGGVVHWTHRDPRGRHQRGWIEHDGRVVD